MSWANGASWLDNDGWYKNVSSGGSSSVIQSIRQGSITLAASASTGTYTITPGVVAANTMLVWNGINTDLATTNYARAAVWITLTNGSTVTATRESTSTNAVTVQFTIVEFASGVNSIQYGQVVITGGGSAGILATGTSTISTVGSNAFVVWLGSSIAATGLGDSDISSTVSFSGTTVTGSAEGNVANRTISFAVVDLGSTVVSAVQQKSLSSSAAVATDTDTLTALTVGNTLLFYNGDLCVSSNVDVQGFQSTHVLTNSTTATFVRSGSGATPRTHAYTAVTFAGAALNGSIQRSTIALSASTSNTGTLSTSVNTAKSFVNWGNFLSATGNASATQPILTFTNSNTITASTTAAGSPTASYEVIQFL